MTCNSLISIRRATTDAEFRAAAEIMASTEPWITLGRTVENMYRAVSNCAFEAYVAVGGEQVVGIALLAIDVPLIKGYIAALAVGHDHRNRGIGSQLLGFAEGRILGVSPNVFLCVSSFNVGAIRFYLRHGYRQVGVLEHFAIPDHHELLLRKTSGPWSSFVPRPVIDPAGPPTSGR